MNPVFRAAVSRRPGAHTITRPGGAIAMERDDGTCERALVVRGVLVRNEGVPPRPWATRGMPRNLSALRTSSVPGTAVERVLSQRRALAGRERERERERAAGAWWWW